MRNILLFLLFFVGCICVAMPLNWYPVDSLFYNAKTKENLDIAFDNTISTRCIIFNQYLILFPFGLNIGNAENVWLFTDTFDDNGYEYLTRYSDSLDAVQMFVVRGKYNFLYLMKSIYGYSGAIRNVSLQLNASSWNEIVQNQEPRRGEHYILHQGIQNINASSYLSENIKGSIINYDVELLKEKIKVLKLEDPNNFEYLNFKRCWAEGVIGPGVGEYLEVDFSWPSSELTILNGFIDFARMNLYKDNNRLKRIRIESTLPAFEIEYVFDDMVKFHDIQLPMETEHVRITIIEVFPGRKYDDTCISMIAIPPQRWRTFEDERNEVFSLLNNSGVFKAISEIERR